jgi:hypothetical protein
MTDRRKFLKSAAALSATPLAGRAAFAGPSGLASFDAVVYDSRHAASLEFAARAEQAGLPARGMAGDITRLWQSELLGQWRRQPGAIAGLTERPALFLLEQLGWEHGLRVVFQAEHEPTGQGLARHDLIRGGNGELGQALAAAGQRWPTLMADALLADSDARSRDFRPSDAAMTAGLGATEKLYSWIIAPRSAD